MKLNEFLTQAHLRIQASKGQKITQAEMARDLGVSSRTYIEYLRGTNAPVGMCALLNVVSMLEERDLADLLQKWKMAQTKAG